MSHALRNSEANSLPLNNREKAKNVANGRSPFVESFVERRLVEALEYISKKEYDPAERCLMIVDCIETNNLYTSEKNLLLSTVYAATERESFANHYFNLFVEQNKEKQQESKLSTASISNLRNIIESKEINEEAAKQISKVIEIKINKNDLANTSLNNSHALHTVIPSSKPSSIVRLVTEQYNPYFLKPKWDEKAKANKVTSEGRLVNF